MFLDKGLILKFRQTLRTFKQVGLEVEISGMY